MKQLKGLDLKRARLVPSSVFASPDEVVNESGLSPSEKLTILRRWEFDARKVSGLARRGESAAGGATMLFQVQRALEALSRAPGAPPKFAKAVGERADGPSAIAREAAYPAELRPVSARAGVSRERELELSRI